MTGEEGLNEVIHDVERIEHQLDEVIDELKHEQDAQRHLPGDEGLSRVFPADPPNPSRRAPELGS
jgi:hypothetical protein